MLLNIWYSILIIKTVKFDIFLKSLIKVQKILHYIKNKDKSHNSNFIVILYCYTVAC